MARPTVVVTRPEPDASVWVRQLREAGWPALALPLLDIGLPARPADLQRLAECQARWSGFDAVMFVSPQAVRHFFQGAAKARLPGAARCWSPGPGTARALREAGIAAAQIDTPPLDAGQFDSEALWQVVGPWLTERVAARPDVGLAGTSPTCRVLVVRGDSTAGIAHPVTRADKGAEAGTGTGTGTGTDTDPDADPDAEPGPGRGREWLAAQCRGVGAEVEFCVAYERRPAVWSAGQVEQTRLAAGTGIWLLSSSEGLSLLRQRLPEAPWSAARALATHPRIAESARALGIGYVNIVRPALADVLRGLESLCERTD